MKEFAISFCKNRDFNYEEVMAFLKFCEGRSLISDSSLSLTKYLNFSDDMSCTIITDKYNCSNFCHECTYSDKYCNANIHFEKTILSYILNNSDKLDEYLALGINCDTFKSCKVFNNSIFKIYREIFEALLSQQDNLKEVLIKKYSNETKEAKKYIYFTIDELLNYNCSHDEFRKALEKLEIEKPVNTDPVKQAQLHQKQKTTEVNSSLSNIQYDYTDAPGNHVPGQMGFLDQSWFSKEKKKEIKIIKLEPNENIGAPSELNDTQIDISSISFSETSSKIIDNLNNADISIKPSKLSIDSKPASNLLPGIIDANISSKKASGIKKVHNDAYENTIFSLLDQANNNENKTSITETFNSIPEINLIKTYNDFKKIYNDITMSIMLLLEYFEDTDELLLAAFRFGKYSPLYLLNLKDKDIVSSLMPTFKNKDYIKVSFDSCPLIWRMLQSNIEIDNYFSIRTAYSVVNFNGKFKLRKEIIEELDGLKISENLSPREEIYVSLKRYQNIYKTFMKKKFNTDTLKLFYYENDFNRLLGNSYKTYRNFSQDDNNLKFTYSLVDNCFNYEFFFDSKRSDLISKIDNNVFIEVVFFDIHSHLDSYYEEKSTTLLGYTFENDHLSIMKNE
ncbi:MAG: hypothetical protein MJA82_20360, partial [Clostridia bacterium]|nr:hypothetical protein [Clostridia bacterium]